MSDDELRSYFEEMSDVELRDCFAAGSSGFEPGAWRIIGEQMHLRELDDVEDDREIALSVAPIRAAPVASMAALLKRVEAGGTIALILAAITLVLGTALALKMRNGQRTESRVITLTTMYVIAGILMRRKHDMWAAGVAALVTTALFLSNCAYLASSHLWIYLAFSVWLYSPPIYWLWRAFMSARVLNLSRGAVADILAE